MYEKIKNELDKRNQIYTLRKKTLNTINFQKVLNEQPTVMFLVCHGELVYDVKEQKMTTYFCFEQNETPSMIHKYKEQELRKLLQGFNY